MQSIVSSALGVALTVNGYGGMAQIELSAGSFQAGAAINGPEITVAFGAEFGAKITIGVVTP